MRTEIVAELSCNHLGDFQRAIRLVESAAAAGADAVKLQHDPAGGGLTLDCDLPWFKIREGPWAGQTMHDLYTSVWTPWEWTSEIMGYAVACGVECFSTPGSIDAVEFLEKHGVGRYKVSSFEITDIPLLRAIAATGKPCMVSLGCAEPEDIERCMDIIPRDRLTLLHCISRYPTPVEEANLARIPALARDTGLPVGLSDHSLGDFVPTLAVALGACAIEKHFTLSRADGGPDAGFSMEPAEFKTMVDKVRLAEQAMEPREVKPDRQFVKSLFVVQDVRKGERFTAENVGVIRPGDGLHPRFYDRLIGREAARDVKRGEPMALDMVMGFGVAGLGGLG